MTTAPSTNPTASGDASSADATSARLGALTDALAPRLARLEDVAADLHAHPEIRFTEVHAAARLTAELEEAGFAVERGFAGLETAFVGRWSTTDDPDAPRIAIFCEYDALEGIGHACGHNLIAAMGLGAGLLAKDALTADPAPAHLVVIGSPGEEGAAGKVPMIDAGVLDGVDAAIMAHPGGADVAGGTSLSRVALDIAFTGRASHAAASPESGINALDAATLSLTAIGLLRQQMTTDVRIHGIVTDGGQAPNIIPERAALRVFVRAASRGHLLDDVVPRVRACFEGAALATGCEVTISENTPPYFSMKSNPTLVELARTEMEALGRTVGPDEAMSGSTDMGNVSHVVPAIHPNIKLEAGIDPHTREFAAAAAGPEARSVIADGARLLAGVALRAIREPDVLARARREFDETEG